MSKYVLLVVFSVGILVEVVVVIQGDQCVQCADITSLQHFDCLNAALKDCPSTTNGGCAVFTGNITATSLSASGVIFKYCTQESNTTCRNISSLSGEVTGLQPALEMAAKAIGYDIQITNARGTVCVEKGNNAAHYFHRNTLFFILATLTTVTI